MSIEEAIVELLLGNDALVGLIGDRIYPLYVPQGERRDCIVYQQLSGSDSATTDGSTGLVDSRFQFTCLSGTYAGAVAIMKALVNVLKNYSGTINSLLIQRIEVILIADIPAINEQAEQLNRFGKFVDMILSYNE